MDSKPRFIKPLVVFLYFLPLLIVIFLFSVDKYKDLQKAKTKQQKLQEISKKIDNNKKKLQQCIVNQDNSIAQSVQTECINQGIPDSNCFVSSEKMAYIRKRVEENKQICRNSYPLNIEYY